MSIWQDLNSDNQPAQGAHQAAHEWETRTALVEVGARMYQRGLIAGYDGNLSARLDSTRLLVTPSGVCKGELDPDWLVITDLAGRPLNSGEGERSPSSELALHLEIYQQRPDVQAIVHAHPPHAIALTLAGISLAGGILPEVVATLGHIPTTEYGTPSSEASAEVSRRLIRTHDALLLARHGAVTVGSDLWDAYFKLETVEHLAKIVATTWQLTGKISELPAAEIIHFSDNYWVKQQQAQGRSEICYGPGRCHSV
jgi:L-fuculose-phosphate aldolase